ncbi:MAG TPA: hypothetical protein VLB69_14640 [Rudaea sp.]|nr:hypothetical protein [Rudaea sp.]
MKFPVNRVCQSPSHVAAMATDRANGNTSAAGALLLNDRVFMDGAGRAMSACFIG